GISNVLTLPSCVDLTIAEKADSSSKKVSLVPQGKLRIVFTGGVYVANEDAILFFLKTIEKVKDIEVIFATTTNRSYLENVSIGFVPKRECYELQRNADILLLPLSFKCPYPEEIECAFPTKSLEYLAVGKPILAIVPKGTFIHDFVEKNNVGIVVTELSEQKILDAIKRLMDPENRKIFSENAAKTILLYDARRQAKRLYDIIQNVISSFQSDE
ncbi:MAG: glycosyltransferase, partial [Candidatus Bathyarchaeia archaeon]